MRRWRERGEIEIGEFSSRGAAGGLSLDSSAPMRPLYSFGALLFSF